MSTSDSPKDLSRFAKLSFDDFRRMANDSTLSAWEKIGFPDSYRKDFDTLIFEDIANKLPPLQERGGIVADIGPGCSDLATLIIEHCAQQSHQLLLVDSAEMLALLPQQDGVRHVPAYFPDCPALFEEFSGRVNVLICYSVFHYIFSESNIWRFLDAALSLLAPGGMFLLGDIPNISKRKRFFASAAGIAYHKKFVGRDETPEVLFNSPTPDQIDDAVVMAVLNRARSAGFDAYVLPQNSALPMSNRREDILIRRP